LGVTTGGWLLGNKPHGEEVIEKKILNLPVGEGGPEKKKPQANSSVEGY